MMTTRTRRWRTMGRTLPSRTMSTQTLSEFTAVDARTSLGNRESDPPIPGFLPGNGEGTPIPDLAGKQGTPDSRFGRERESGSRLAGPGSLLVWAGVGTRAAPRPESAETQGGGAGSLGRARRPVSGTLPHAAPPCAAAQWALQAGHLAKPGTCRMPVGSPGAWMVRQAKPY